MRYYCTLFDVNYLARGIALNASLLTHSHSPYKLFVLCMDNDTFRILSHANLPNVQLISLAVLERNITELVTVRGSRNWMEYCWTCASQFMQYLMRYSTFIPEGELLTYLDSDLFFFSDPQTAFNEISTRDIAIVPHRFRPGLERLEPNGIYNVGWLSIRNSDKGMKCLNTWALQCREWCYHRNEDGKFGDQAYLDKWPSLYFDHLAIIQHIGVGLAPWNVQQYKIIEGEHKGQVLIARDCCSTVPLVFYHFHEFKHHGATVIQYTRHPLRQEDRTLIYAPYIEAIVDAVFVADVATAQRNRELELLRQEADAQ